MEINIIFGPPGTGKTTELIKITEGLLESGCPPEEICFISFTRRAANEAKSRAMAKFKLDEDRLPWFRTIHSLAFSRLGLSRNKIMGNNDYLKLGTSLGVSITFRGMTEDGLILGMSRGDRLFFMENMARAQCKSVREYWEEHPDEDIAYYELLRCHETLRDYKEFTGKCDFTDMVVAFTQAPDMPKIRALIVDEAQDLTPLQWRMVEVLQQQVEECYIAGDDDQAIFKWAGADVKKFMSIAGHQRVLPQSYRVPQKIQEFAVKITDQIRDRISKEWKSTREVGEIRYENSMREIDMTAGSWLILARNLFFLQSVGDLCKINGFVFSSPLGSPISGEALRAIRCWETIRRGGEINTTEARLIYDHISTKVGVLYGAKKRLDSCPDNETHTLKSLHDEYGLVVDDVWHKSLDRIEDFEREYFIAAIRRGEKLLSEPRIRLDTIHSVKGGECENVVLIPDMAERTWKEYQKNPDDEHRVWYVAVTRTKKSLWMMSPTTTKYYDLNLT